MTTSVSRRSIELVPVGERQGLGSVTGGEDAVAVRLEDLLRQLPEAFLVLDEEDVLDGGAVGSYGDVPLLDRTDPPEYGG